MGILRHAEREIQICTQSHALAASALRTRPVRHRALGIILSPIRLLRKGLHFVDVSTPLIRISSRELTNDNAEES